MLHCTPKLAAYRGLGWVLWVLVFVASPSSPSTAQVPEIPAFSRSVHLLEDGTALYP